MSNRSAKIYFDPYLFFSLFTLSVLGLFFLYSASNADISIVLKQSVYIFLGFAIMIAVSQADPDVFRRTSLVFIIFSVLLLGITFLFGPEINGAQRWVRLGPFSFQSSELLKLALPIFLANFLFDKRLPIQSREIVISLAVIFIAFILVARQPDLGTGLIVALSGLFVLFLSGLKVAGKSGTAELVSLDSKEAYLEVRDTELLRDHSIIVAFGPMPNPQYAVSVVIENGESGGAVAGPVAIEVLKSLLNE